MNTPIATPASSKKPQNVQKEDAMWLQKELIIRWRETDLPSAVQAGVNAFATAYASREPREGAEAFLAKRAPRFGRA